MFLKVLGQLIKTSCVIKQDFVGLNSLFVFFFFFFFFSKFASLAILFRGH